MASADGYAAKPPAQTVTFLEHDAAGVHPRRVWSAERPLELIRQLRFEGATIAGLARQLATMEYRGLYQAVSASRIDDSFAGVRVLGLTSMCGTTRTGTSRAP